MMFKALNLILESFNGWTKILFLEWKSLKAMYYNVITPRAYYWYIINQKVNTTYVKFLKNTTFWLAMQTSLLQVELFRANFSGSLKCHKFNNGFLKKVDTWTN